LRKSVDLLLTATAPAVWGSTYLITTEALAGWHPLTLAMLRALPAGLLLLLLIRQLPNGGWWWRAGVLGALNFSIFWVMLFVSAYRLPGGVAATVGAVQPLLVILLALQLRSSLQVSALSASLVRATPDRPGDDERGPDAALAEAARDAPGSLEGPADERRAARLTRGGVCSAAAFAR
jgi:hypothetical protein